MLPDQLHLFLEDGPTTVACKNQEATDWTLSGVEILIQVASYHQSVNVTVRECGLRQTQIIGL